VKKKISVVYVNVVTENNKQTDADRLNIRKIISETPRVRPEISRTKIKQSRMRTPLGWYILVRSKKIASSGL